MLYSALILGLLGSIHCMGMCGAIALALPIDNKYFYQMLWNRIVYNLGRVITYAFLGVVVGLVGKGLLLGISQQMLSVAVGILLLTLVVFPTFYHTIDWLNIFQPFTQWLKAKLGRLLQQKNTSSFLLIGILNGFLPCGLIYFALAGALATGNIAESALYMIIFGLATIPAMLVVSLAGRFVFPTLKRKAFQLVPVFLVVLAILFILRGLNLGIPYLSPQLIEYGQQIEMKCCKVTE
ncbi:MAG: sulfite exporter TauE/SafE family protein [Microscillaceae bacterium]|nr:sulfite exporter TauE/SafE family protein [Microscillaceae bacterium]MDW8460108.1 sulfite exporter TauE/SafE family protein [Cytophagales bacterium]